LEQISGQIGFDTPIDDLQAGCNEPACSIRTHPCSVSAMQPHADGWETTVSNLSVCKALQGMKSTELIESIHLLHQWPGVFLF